MDKNVLEILQIHKKSVFHELIMDSSTDVLQNKISDTKGRLP